MNRALSLAAVAAATAALAACGNNTTDHLKISDQLINGKPGFSIATVTVTKGDKVDVRLDNPLPVAHGFSIDDFGIHRVAPLHASEEFTFRATKVGQFRIYCQLHPAHVPAQMIVVG